MTRVSLHRAITVSAGVLALAVIAEPLQYQSDGSFVLESPAFAQAGGNGRGQGNGQGGNQGGGQGGGNQGGGQGAGNGGNQGGGQGASNGGNQGGGQGGGQGGNQGGGQGASNGGNQGGGQGGGQGAQGAGGNGQSNGNGQSQGQGQGESSGRGTIASALGGLNAAHASETALENAAPNSRVGLIAAYNERVAATDQALADLPASRPRSRMAN